LQIDAVDTCCLTPLFVAAREGCLEVVKELIERGADKNICETHGATPLHIAVKKNLGR